MRTFKLNKLVRDGVFENMLKLGQKVQHKVIAGDEFISALKNKLLEEAKEFNPADSNSLEELADLLEVIEQLGLELGANFSDLRTKQLARSRAKGKFKRGIFVESVTLSNNDPWVSYYEQQPDRFPEAKRNRADALVRDGIAKNLN